MKRRLFLGSGASVLGAAAFGKETATSAIVGSSTNNIPPNIPEWTRTIGPGVASYPYGQPSNYESVVVRRDVSWLTASPISSVAFSPIHELKGIITPSGLVFERHHAGIPNIDPDDYRLIIHGLVKRPLMLTMEELLRFPSVSSIYFIECPANGGMEWRGAQMEALQFTHGMLGCCEWTGVKLSTLLEETGLKQGAGWILAEGADGSAMTRSIPMEKALDDAMIVYGQNGEALRPEQGYPVRLLNPGWEGSTSIKWLRRLEIGDRPWYHREETAKYTDLMPDGRARQFTWVMEANSVITFPCPEKSPVKPGYHELSGLAWSGQGCIKQVDVSFDGGVNWTRANLKGLILPKALTRFSLDWKWDGRPLLLQSRAIDETGYVQPTLAHLRSVRGVNSIYHNNAIHTWQLASSGNVTNVQVD